MGSFQAEDIGQALVMKGWVKLHRKVQTSRMYQSLTSKQRDVFTQCLLMANHVGQEWEWRGKVFCCEPGQFITSLESLKTVCAKDVSLRNIRTALSKLEKWSFLTIESTKTGRLITIINWNTYQSPTVESDKENDNQVTNDRQTGDKQVTTNKNDKKVKNVKKEDIVREDASAPSDHTSFVQYAFDAFKNRYGEKMMFDGGKDGKIVKQLLATYGLERLKELWDDFMQSDDDFLDNVSGRSIGVFKTQINKLITHKGPVMPVESYMDKVKRQQGLL